MDNRKGIKEIYFNYFMEFILTLDKYPEQEVKIAKLTEWLKVQPEKVKYLLAYYIERIISGKEYKMHFLDFKPTENSEAIGMTKYNIVQLRYASTIISYSKRVEQSVLDFVSSLSNKYVYLYYTNYLMNKNLTGIRVKSLEEIYTKFRLKKFIVEPMLSDFSYERIEPPKKKKKLPTLKMPVVLFNNPKGEYFYFYKYKGEVKSNLKEVELFKLTHILERYSKIAIVGAFTEDKIDAYICTTKDKVVQGLIKDNRYTLQNSFRYLRSDINRVNNSIKGMFGFIKFPRLYKADGHLAYDLDMLFSVLRNEGVSNKVLLFRNEFIFCNRIKLYDGVVHSIDYPNNKLNIIGVKNEEMVQKITDVSAESISIGDILNIIEINKYKFIKKGC